MLGCLLLSCSPTESRAVPYELLTFDTPEDRRVQKLILELYALPVDSEPGLRRANAIGAELLDLRKQRDLELSDHLLLALQSRTRAQVCEIRLLQILGTPDPRPDIEVEWKGLFRSMEIVLAKAASARITLPDRESALRYRLLAVRVLRSLYPPALEANLPIPGLKDPDAARRVEDWLSWAERVVTTSEAPANLDQLLEELVGLEKELQPTDEKTSSKAVERANQIEKELLEQLDHHPRGIAEGILKWLSSAKAPRFCDLYMLELLARIQDTFAVYEAGRDGPRLRFLLQKASDAKRAFPAEDLRVMYRALIGEVLRSVLLSRWGQQDKAPPSPSSEDKDHEVKMDRWLEWIGRRL